MTNFYSGANQDCYNALRYELANQYGLGNDLCPKTVDQCLTMLNRRKDAAPRNPRTPQQQCDRNPKPADDGEALVFAQGTSSGVQKVHKYIFLVGLCQSDV